MKFGYEMNIGQNAVAKYNITAIVPSPHEEKSNEINKNHKTVGSTDTFTIYVPRAKSTSLHGLMFIRIYITLFANDWNTMETVNSTTT